MKIKVKADQLHQALAEAIKATDKHTDMAVLGDVLLIASEGRLVLRATDLEIGLAMVVPAEVEAEGRLCVRADRLGAVVKGAGQRDLTLEPDDNQCLIRFDGGRYRVPCDDPEMFPNLPDFPAAEAATVNHDDLASALSAVSPAMAVNDGRYNLRGVLFEPVEDSDRMHLVATDGHRLHVVEKPNDLGLGSPALVPAKAVKLLRSMLPGRSKVEATRKDSTAWFEMWNGGIMTAVLSIRLVDAKFPDWRQVTPGGDDMVELTMPRPAVLEALDRISALLQGDSHGVKLTTDPDKGRLTIDYQNANTGRAAERIPVEASAALTVGFNIHYLKAALRVMDSETVTLAQAEPARPAKITGPADDGLTCVVMPMSVGS